MRRVLAALVVLAVLSPIAAPAAVGAQSDAGAGETDANNTSVVRHEDPQAGLERGNIGAVREHLEGRMGTILVDCAEGLAAAADACDRLDGEYDDSLEKYVDLTGGTAGGSDDDSAETYREAREDQREYADTYREFRETLSAYREARRNGNTERARRLARKLQRLADELESVSVDLVEEYETIGNTTNTNVSNVTRSVRATTNETRSETVRIARDVFEPASVTARAERPRGSFTEPLVVVGRVTGNGTEIADARVAVDAGGRTVRTRTNESGWYRVDYRPTTAPTGDRSLRVRYLPRPASPYLGANATVPVEIEQETPDVTVDADDPLRFGENATFTGRVAVGGVGAPGVPVVVTVGGTRLGRVTTGDDGRFSLDAPFPRSVDAGERTVRARVALSGRALAGTDAVTAARVAETRTVLALNTTRLETGAVRVSGRLRTANGRAVPNATVALAADGGRERTARTSGDGAFSTTFDPGEAAALTARYDGAGNLAPAEERASIPSRQGDRGLLPGDVPLVLVGGGVVLVVGVLGALGVLIAVRRRRSETPDPGAEGLSRPGLPSESTGTPAGPVLLARARELADEGATVEAIGTAYAAVRATLGEEGARTHWEFFRDRQDDLDPQRASALRRLTERYEAATFAGRVSTDALESSLSAATRLVEPEGRDDGSGGERSASGTD